ncbi:hypothetical protein [Nonomuraea sp. CA-141351]|uniref:MmyB family transcriptional regulator n=1 Tax=Nonomuraea sp. CA-141351 TaxID=3239996 RepID=UPI003D902FD4
METAKAWWACSVLLRRRRARCRRMLDVLNGVSPALILNDRRDVPAANHLASALIAGFDALPHRDRNLVRYILLDPGARELYTDWDEVGEVVAADLRLAAGRRPDDSRLSELIGELCVKVPESTAGGPAIGWISALTAFSVFHPPLVGELTLYRETLTFPADPDQIMCLYTAEPGTASAQALGLLASWTAPDSTVRGASPESGITRGRILS